MIGVDRRLSSAPISEQDGNQHLKEDLQIAVELGGLSMVHAEETAVLPIDPADLGKNSTENIF